MTPSTIRPDTPATSGLGVPCTEAQADGVPCAEIRADCSICGRATPCPHTEDSPAAAEQPQPPAA
jgi:hypothetical protein